MEFMTRTVLTSHLRPRGLRPIVIPIFILGAHAPSTSSADAISLKAFTLIHRFSGLEASTETSNKRHVVSNDTETSDQLGPVTLSFSSVGVRLDPSLDAALKTTITSAVRPSGFHAVRSTQADAIAGQLGNVITSSDTRADGEFCTREWFAVVVDL